MDFKLLLKSGQSVNPTVLEESNNRIGGEPFNDETLKVVATDPRASSKYNYHSSVLCLQMIHLYSNKSCHNYIKPPSYKDRQIDKQL